jgi:glycosyltransferase involved in cell wall biosynthesis
MRILHILADDANSQEEQNLINMVCAFKTLGIEQFAILNPNQNIAEKLSEQNVEVNIQKFSGIFDLRTKKFINEYINKTQPHIVQTHTPISARFCDKTPDKVAHVGILNGDNNDNKTISICNAVFSFGSNDNETDKVFNVFPILEEVDQDALAVNREEFNTPKDCFLLGTSTETTEGFKIDPVLKALREVPEIYLWIRCAEKYQKELLELSMKRALHDRVRFIPTTIQEFSFLKALDLFVIPEQKKDPFSIVSKPWLSQTPVLSGLSDPSSTIQHKINGWVVDGTNVFRMREAIIKLMEESEIREQTSHTAYENFQQLYKREKTVKDYMKAYQKVLSTLL